ncbi:DUF6892 domain-containing protein [Aquimarina algiphila]|uniref:DUF6892 domain-containing protein n=1 Tax=Aquimarina algiphila TaxID=2047982 RepID=UPI00232E336F|nr:hypothetical protein [Aquimarina algiphila]
MKFRNYFFRKNKSKLIVSPLILKHLELIEKAPYNDKSTRDKICRQWKECINKDVSFIYQLYNVLIHKLENFDGEASEETKNLYKFLTIFSSSDYISLSGEKTKHAISKNNEELIRHIKKLLEIPDFQIIEINVKTYNKGNLGDLIQKIFALYFYHTSYLDEKYRSEISQYILPLYKAFPENKNTLITALLRYHPNAIDNYAELIMFYITQKNTKGILTGIALKMFGLNADREDFEHKNAVKIIKAILDKSDSWTEDVKSFFIDTFFFNCFDIKLNTKEEQLQEVNEKIEELKSIGIHQGVKHYKKEKKNIEDHFEAIKEKRWNDAVQRIAVSKTTSESIRLVIRAFTGNSKINYLTLLICDSNSYKNEPKKYTSSQSPKVIFKDFALKLWVIEELMYNQNLLTPKFDIAEFVKEHEKRQIDIESDGYNIIPEIKAYFQNLDIPQELLNQVTELYMDDGFGGGAQVYYQLWPFWDPGVGDEIIPISNTAIDDLEFLPNLKKIIGLESKPDNQRLVQGIEEKGVVLMLEN